LGSKYANEKEKLDVKQVPSEKTITQQNRKFQMPNSFSSLQFENRFFFVFIGHFGLRAGKEKKKKQQQPPQASWLA
jgi:hypothetical protein